MKRHFIKLTFCLSVFALFTVMSYGRQTNDPTIALRQILSNHKKGVEQNESVVVIEKGDNDFNPEFTLDINLNGSFSKDIRNLKITREQFERQLYTLCGFHEL